MIDYWEAFYGTDPSRPDTDNDGIRDGEEQLHRNNLYPYENSALSNNNVPACSSNSDTFIGGWEFVYDYNGTTPLTTWVNSNPLDPDTDDDSLIDGQERIYGYHPGVLSTLNVLGLDSSLETNSDALPYVASTDTVTYTANITNELDNRFLLGLLQTEVPLDTVIDNQSLGVLAPRTSLQTQGTVDVSQTSLNSNNGGLGIRAGVNINEGTGRLFWLNMNEPAGSSDFHDSSYYGNDPFCSFSCPTANSNYLTFSGPQQYLIVQENAQFDTNSFTVGFYMYDDGASANGFLFRKKSFGIWKSNDQIMVTTNSGTPLFSTVPIPKNEWVHIMVTVDNSDVTLYIDGIEQQTTNSAPAITNTGLHMQLGWGQGSGNIRMDEAEFFPYTIKPRQNSARLRPACVACGYERWNNLGQR